MAGRRTNRKAIEAMRDWRGVPVIWDRRRNPVWWRRVAFSGEGGKTSAWRTSSHSGARSAIQPDSECSTFRRGTQSVASPWRKPGPEERDRRRFPERSSRRSAEDALRRSSRGCRRRLRSGRRTRYPQVRRHFRRGDGDRVDRRRNPVRRLGIPAVPRSYRPNPSRQHNHPVPLSDTVDQQSDR